jgi:predicted DNA-binding ribbon-helix-helix protein
MTSGDPSSSSPLAGADPEGLSLQASRPVKRSFSIRGHRTSISLEAAFWDALGQIAKERRRPLAQLVGDVDAVRGEAGLSSSVRIFILDHYRAASVAPAKTPALPGE